MKKVFLFMMMSLDGYVEGPDHDLSWHQVDDEFGTFAAKQMREADTILFGRRTYQLMEGFWPRKDGLEGDPIVASLMNNTPKVVVSQSLENIVETDIWKHVTLIKKDVIKEITTLKNQEGDAIIVLGSNNLCTTLLKEGLLDEIRIMVNPVAIGQGTPLFAGLHAKVLLQLSDTRKFGNGNVLLTYQVIKPA